MKESLSRLRSILLRAAAAATAFALFAAQPAAATETAPFATQHADVTVTTTHARIVNVYRGRAATAYERRFERVSDDGYDWAPVGYRDVIRVVVEVTDPRASRVDADERPQRFTLELDPSQLSGDQNAALSNRRLSRRTAPFQLNVERIASTERRLDRSQSYLCSGDEFRCEDRLVFRDAPIERVRFSVT